MAGNFKADSSKIKAYRFGKIAEYLAAFFLICKGYRILKMRYKVKVGEVDIIAAKKDFIIFVEVKARQDYNAAVMSISDKQKQRISRTAEFFFMQNSGKKDLKTSNCRFDVVIIVPVRWPVHIKDAW
jgi:putative endonuclease